MSKTFEPLFQVKSVKDMGSLFRKYGPNLQNIPVPVKEEDKVRLKKDQLVTADYAELELRYLASEVPTEVLASVKWKGGEIPAELIRFAPKATVSRGEAWSRIPLPPKESDRKNPWRKAHSENYWVWFCVGEVPA
jgi:hypothetical protein